MATQPTNLPVPSESPRDLKFNAGKIDEFVTSLVNTYIDRFGNEHYTIEGLRWLAQQAISQFGYITLDSFEDGNTLTLPNQVLRLDSTGEYYRWDGVLPKIVPTGSTPESTGGVGPGAWLSVGDASARQWAETVFRALPVARAMGSFQSGGSAESDFTALFNTVDGFYYTPVSGAITVPSGSTPDASWKCVGLLNGFDISDVRNWVTDFSDADANTIILQLMADSLGEGGTIIFPSGTVTTFNLLWIKNRFVTICGTGTIDGTIRVCRGTYATSSDIYMNTTIRDVSFITSRNLDDAIQLAYSRMGTITGIKDFRGYKNGIRVIDIAEIGASASYGQMVNRWIVSNNHYGGFAISNGTVESFIRVDASAGIQFPMADWIIKGNEGHAIVDHIIITATDGITLCDNIMFFPGYQTQNDSKRSHLRIDGFGTGWVHIHDNKFFESGGTSVYLNGACRFNIHDNLYAFGAQRVPVPQLVITGTPIAGEYYTQGIIHNEVIAQPGGEGISIGNKSGRLKIHSNNIQNPSSPTYYYGSSAQPTANGIIIGTDTTAIEVFNNTVSSGVNNLPSVTNNIYYNNVIDNITSGGGIRIDSTIKTLSVTTSTSTIDVGPWMAVTVSVSSSFGLSVVSNSGSTKVITITNTGTSSFNIVNGANLKLAGSANVTLTAGSSLTLRVASGGAATEVSRAII
ncbi:tail fiber/spike domain-containing protein [Citrobacter farmeri]|uniref:tail fiber/spike domain-containing protein n=1 Tax=Citrobacter farmeri TaxID=67824 RepID=UPI00388DB70D